MKYEWIDSYLLAKAGISKNLQTEWNWIRYVIDGKMCVAVCLDEQDNPYYITLKLRPENGMDLQEQHEDIIPGYYMNKKHWNSIKVNGSISDQLLKDMLDEAYELVLSSFSKKKTVRDIIFIIKRGILMKRCIGMTGIVWKFKGGLK